MPVMSSKISHMNWLVEPKVAPVRMVPGAAIAAFFRSAKLFHETLPAAPMMSGVEVSNATVSKAGKVKSMRPLR